MEVVAISKTGFLIEANENEIKEILTSVNGKRPDKIEVGNKIPAIDYASTLTKLKSLKTNSYFTQLITYQERFNKEVDELKVKVDHLQKIEI